MGLGKGSGRDHLITMSMQDAFAAYQSVRHRLPDVQREAPCHPARDLSAIADQFDVFLLDAFGVLNIGETPIQGVPERVAALQAMGKRILVVTNAAGQPHATLRKKYAKLGYNIAREDIISSRLTTLKALEDEPKRRWGVMADKGLGDEDFGHLDFEFLGDDRHLYDSAEGFLLLGSAKWTEDQQVLLEQSLARAPRPVFVGNPDIVAPRETGFSVEPGRFAHRLADQSGVQPRFFGKPFRNIYDLAFARLGPGYDPSRVVMVGDSLHTDILGGQTAGVKTALISGFGFFADQDVATSVAASGIQPDFILDRP